MWHNPAHMQAGHAAASKSRKTPKHLIPHLKGLAMKKVQGKPITGAKTQMQATPITGRAGGLQQAASQIKASPMPFQNPQGSVGLGAPKGPTPHLGTGATKNASGLPTKKAGAKKHSNFYGSR